MALQKIDSRGVYSLVAPESVFGAFPAGAAWRKLDLNSYSDAGSSYESTPREVMDGSRRAKKGKQSGKDVNFGYNIDITKGNTIAQVASFLYNTPKEKFTSRSVVAGSPLTTMTTVALTSITATTAVLASAPPAGSLVAGDIIIIEDGVNDRTPLVVTTLAAGTVTFAPLNATQSVRIGHSLAGARIVKVGLKAAAADMVLAVSGATATLTTTAADFTKLGLTVGEWIFVGGDDTVSKFATTPPFYARVSAIAAKVLTFDSTTSPIVADAGAGKTINIFLGTFIFDGSIRTSYTHARYLGKQEDGKNLVETFTGCVPNEMSVNLSEASYANLDLAYMAIDHRPTAVDTATFNSTYANVSESKDDDAYHTSSDVFRQRLYVEGSQLNPAAITSFAQEATLSITNNISADTGLGKLGAFDYSTGNFGLSGSVTAYFIGLEAVNAIRCNCTVGMDMILASKNTGIVIDMPAFTIGGSIDVEANTSIKMSLEQAAFASSKFGFVLGWTAFAYLPAAAMPSGLDGCDC